MSQLGQKAPAGPEIRYPLHLG